MDTWIDTLYQLLTQWGYFGLLIASLLAGSVVPFSSELVLFALLKLGLNPMGCLVAASIGNTAGSLTCYGMGRLGRTDWLERYFHIQPKQIERVHTFVQGRGAWMGFFAFLPTLGSAISIALGYMRSNLLLTTLAMLTGKVLRYLVVLWLANQC